MLLLHLLLYQRWGHVRVQRRQRQLWLLLWRLVLWLLLLLLGCIAQPDERVSATHHHTGSAMGSQRAVSHAARW